MQIFVPYADVVRSLRCLDRKRLFSQLREAVQCLVTIAALERHQADPETHPLPAYGNHVALRSWKGSKIYLRWYACKCSEIIRSTLVTKAGVPYNTEHWDAQLRGVLGGWISDEPISDKPFWWGNDQVHGSYRAMLHRKNPEHYPQFASDAPLYEDYVWPVHRLTKASTSKRSGIECPGAPKKRRQTLQPEDRIAPRRLSFEQTDSQGAFPQSHKCKL